MTKSAQYDIYGNGIQHKHYASHMKCIWQVCTN